MSFVKIERRMSEWEWFTDPKTAHLFLYLLMSANYKDKTWRGIEVPRGSLVTSEEKLAVKTGLTRQQVRTALNRLISTNNITKVSTKAYTLINIVNYDVFQGSDDDVNQDFNQQFPHQSTNRSTNRSTITKEIKNRRNKEYIKDPADAGPENFVKPSLEEVENYCIEKGFTNIDINRFYDYYEKNGWTVKGKHGGRKKMENWKSAAVNWFRNEAAYNQTNELRNKAREAYIRDVEMKSRRQEEGGPFFFDVDE